MGERAVTVDELVGCYWTGDGLGFNWVLELVADQTFSAEMHGCRGVYANASGTWSLEGESVRLEPRETLPRVLADLRTLPFQDWLLLVPECFREEVETRGPARWSCFYPTAASQTFRDRWGNS